VACVLRNFSEIGAALDVGVKDFIPDRFTLIVVPKKKIISCNVIWRKPKEDDCVSFESSGVG
jgi:hypothetical protein